MALKASKDTYAYEQVGPDAFVRREIKAGHELLPGLFADEEGKQPLDAEENNRTGFGAIGHAYPHQLDENGNVVEEHQPKVAPYEPPVKEGEEVTGQEQTPTAQVEMRQPSGPESDRDELPEPASQQPSQQPTVQKKK